MITSVEPGARFGEATSWAPHVLTAEFHVYPVEDIRQCLVQLNLTVVNDTAPGRTAAKLQIPLPLDAIVCKFEVNRDGVWFPAVPVDTEKGKEVAYREREKCRQAASTSQVMGNVFEIEVSAMAYNQPVQCRLWFRQANNFGDNLPSFGNETMVTHVCHSECTDVFSGSRWQTETSRVCCGDCFGKKHFACHIPNVTVEGSLTLKRIAVVWDVSGSQSRDHGKRHQRLVELASECPGVRFDLWTFDISFRQVKLDISTECLIAELDGLLHDGGTDLTLLPGLFVEAGKVGVDAIFLFSDGMDSFGVVPTMSDVTCPPIHCIVDSPKANLHALRPICTISGGQLLVGDGSYLPLLKPQAFLRRIVTDQTDDCFCDPNDDFQCCPDHHLNSMRLLIEAEGLWICGTLGGVTRITAEVIAGKLQKQFVFDLSDSLEVDPSAAHLLGWLYASQLYASVERDGAAMGADLSVIREQLALQYGFCSPEASLMMLLEPDQFLENKIPCPESHPAHAVWKERMAAKTPAAPSGETDEIGQPKSATGMKQVEALAERLQRYLEDPIPEGVTDSPAASGAYDNASAAESATGIPTGAATETAAGTAGFHSIGGAAAQPGTGVAAGAATDTATGAADAAGSFARSTSAPAAQISREPAPWEYCGELAEQAKAYRCAAMVEKAREAYEEALEIANRELAVTHPLRLGLVLNYSVLLQETGDLQRAQEIVRSGFEDAIAELDNVSEDSYRDSTLIMQLMRDNLTLWSASGEDSATTAPAEDNLTSPFQTNGNTPDNADGGEVFTCQTYQAGQEQCYLPTLEKALSQGRWREVYAELRDQHFSSPSFFLYAASAIFKHSTAVRRDAVRICTNCLDMNIQDAQMLRSVGYFLMKAGDWSLAFKVFDHVRKLAPMEPQSFLDGALIRYLSLKFHFEEATLREAVRLAAVAVTHTWASRFAEVEWPALVLLHLLVAVGESYNVQDIWPLEATLHCPNFDIGLVVWMGWDTDNTDIDLHVVEPSGNEVFYSNPRSRIGGHLSKDMTQGYGPEVYLLKTHPVGRYAVKAKYYSSHQTSALTGTTSAVVWAMRGSADCTVQFETVRLSYNSQKIDVLTVEV